MLVLPTLVGMKDHGAVQLPAAPLFSGKVKNCQLVFSERNGFSFPDDIARLGAPVQQRRAGIVGLIISPQRRGAVVGVAIEATIPAAVVSSNINA